MLLLHIIRVHSLTWMLPILLIVSILIGSLLVMWTRVNVVLALTNVLIASLHARHALHFRCLHLVWRMEWRCVHWNLANLLLLLLTIVSLLLLLHIKVLSLLR